MLGILMLDTQFPRPPGDVGHSGSWRMPVRYARVKGATPDRIVRASEAALLAPFVDAGLRLVGDGARALTTSCGFLVRWQSALQGALPVPVWTSALLALPELEMPGVLTVDGASLGAAELAAAGAAPGTPVQGLKPGCHLQDALLNNRPLLNTGQAREDTVQAAMALVNQHPQVRSIVLECTNLPPYAADVAEATGRPVHHLMTLVHERWEMLK